MSAQRIQTPADVDGVRVDVVVTSGTFSLDGGTWEVDNNVYVIGTDSQCLIIDAAHDAAPILEAVNGREVQGILLTHGHDDHIRVARELADATGAAIYLHPDDWFLYRQVFDADPDEALADGQTFAVGEVDLRVLHTPGHAPGACVFHVPALATVFSGDTLFNGGPGATGRSFSDFDTIVDSISERLLTLPSETLVLTGHGGSTSIGAEAPHRQEWIDRGH
ncbi:glyoxylase-like metal-dependent hydrolase (beta-lactamase superfamily II) [Kineosphaera limosa]|uniref:Metallo-beta-lactamase domain-containing protein n=1 Tax=Kineosphaera limosa NBRC 100340 TaxID=1184609 RepID=K6WPW1_9MICO|nr:MBL fold metallo-hydrolase [Kineosphaera limosa]NYD99731.1 glyoxylase-like metal-dependent hydrolase (beta-lactamase superfamily II) [Kineosphaera limosa]GAB95831.1 hypothetical protein KILIM_027_00140 [Kineosphaera limosa NBRC 100340]